ncbi:MAG TPA: ribonuclease III [Abditibacteriaceae bacterium]|jgi:ribonuclease-3
MASEKNSNSCPDFDALREVLGANVPGELLTLALTHPSAAGEGAERVFQSNQRLEFLGDAILGAVVAGHFYASHHDLPEGTLTQYKAAAVRGSSLAKAAQRLNLSHYLILGKGEEAGGGRKRDTILADAFEALVGALFLSQGFDATRTFILRALAEEISVASQNAVNVKNRLQEKTQAIGLGTPVYQTQDSGALSTERFSAQVFLLNEPHGEGHGKTKQEAECNAARMALDEIEKE